MDDDESAALFAEYARAKVVPVRFRADMRHVGLAVCARVDALVSLSRGPMMLGYASHYGLGLFAAESRLVAS